MNVSQPISFAFWSIFWRFPTVVPPPPTLSESELALRAGTDQLLGRYVEATGSPKFRALVAHHREQIGTGNPDNGLQLLAQSVLLAIEDAAGMQLLDGGEGNDSMGGGYEQDPA